MPPLSTLPPASAQGRRAVGRAFVGGLAALAVAPALSQDCWSRRGGQAEAEAEVAPLQGPQEAHLLARPHLPAPQAQAGRAHRPARPADRPPTPPGAYDEPAVVNGLATALALHLASRFTYGMTPALLQEMGGYPTLQAWLDAQLAPATISDQAADALEGWWPRLAWDAPTMWAHEQAMSGEAWTAMADYQRWCLQRRMRSRRQLLESVTEFFENHLHVPVHDDGVFGFRADYGRTIRAHALGRFDQMLVAAITHPAMGISLDNANSTKTAPNENLGRELLELHTVGRGNYTEDDVKASARILTGYKVAMWTTWATSYNPAAHWTGPVQVMGFSHANADPDGRPVVAAYLTYLAHHPATAHRLARKLASPLRVRRPVRSARRPPGAGLPGQRHRHPPGAPGPGGPPGVHRVQGTQGPQPRGRRRGHLAGARRPGRAAHRRRLGSQRRAVADGGARPGAVRLGPPGRAAGGRRVVVVGVEGAGVLRDPLHAVRRLVADGADDLPPRSRRGCPSSPASR